jgi:hypothetical protein
MPDMVFMQPPGGGEPQEVEATPDILVPMLVAGWRQCPPPAPQEPPEEE